MRRGNNDTPRAGLPLIPGGPLRRLRTLEPAAGVRRHSHAPRAPDTRVHRVQQGGALPLEAIGDDLRERAQSLAHAAVQPRRGQLRFTLAAQVRGDVGPGLSSGLHLGQPPLREEAPVVHQGIAVPRCIPRKDAHLAILHLAQGTTVLPGTSYGVHPFCDKPCRIEPQLGAESPIASAPS